MAQEMRMTAEDLKNLYKWMALQTIANDYFKTLKPKIIDQGIKEMTWQLQQKKMSRSRYREELNNYICTINKRYEFYDRSCVQIVKHYDDSDFMNQAVDYLHEKLDELNIVIE